MLDHKGGSSTSNGRQQTELENRRSNQFLLQLAIIKLIEAPVAVARKTNVKKFNLHVSHVVMVFSQRVAGNLHMATWDEDSHGIPKEEQEEEEEELEEAISLAAEDEVAKAAIANAAGNAAAVVEQPNSEGICQDWDK